jgi:protein tyrosine phosphatase
MQNSPEERMVTQYHYTAWPDHGVPSSVTSVLNFVRRASAANPPDSGPMVSAPELVHLIFIYLWLSFMCVCAR